MLLIMVMRLMITAMKRCNRFPSRKNQCRMLRRIHGKLRSVASFFCFTVVSPEADLLYMAHFLLRFRDAPGGLQDGFRAPPLPSSAGEPSVDFFWRAKSVRPIQTILGTAEQIRREVIPVGFGFADGLEELPPLFVVIFCAVG